MAFAGECKFSGLMQDKGVVLYLTEYEAAVLRRVVHFISGPEKGPRGCMTAIGEALDSIGVQNFAIRPMDCEVERGDIWFTQDYEPRGTKERAK